MEINLRSNNAAYCCASHSNSAALQDYISILPAEFLLSGTEKWNVPKKLLNETDVS